MLSGAWAPLLFRVTTVGDARKNIATVHYLLWIEHPRCCLASASVLYARGGNDWSRERTNRLIQCLLPVDAVEFGRAVSTFIAAQNHRSLAFVLIPACA